jgi:hypothetical protein
MGIDIYARWNGQTEAEERSQVTGYSIKHGHVGYLREAYHGGPYVTKYLVSEAFNADEGQAAIPARTLRRRLPAAVLMHLYRDNKLYGGGKDPSVVDIAQLPATLAKVFRDERPDVSHDEFARALDARSIETAKTLINVGLLPDGPKSLVDFVELCERKELETGEPCSITASY